MTDTSKLRATPETDSCAFWARTAGVFGSNLESGFADDIKHVTAAFGPATDWYVVPVSAARKLERQRDELAEALRNIVELDNGDRPSLWTFEKEFNAGRTILAKIDGEPK